MTIKVSQRIHKNNREEQTLIKAKSCQNELFSWFKFEDFLLYCEHERKKNKIQARYVEVKFVSQQSYMTFLHRITFALQRVALESLFRAPTILSS